MGQSCIAQDRSCQEEAGATQMRSVSIVVMKIQKVEFFHKDAHIFAIRANKGVNGKPFHVKNINLSGGNPWKSSGTNWR